MDKALKPYGFERQKLEWVRVRDELLERVVIQPSRYAGRTVNLEVKNRETEKLYVEILASDGETMMLWGSVRLGHVIDNRDRWWVDAPDGPEEMAALTVQYGLPWFDRFRTLEEQAVRWYGRGIEGRGYYAPGLIGLALTLYRMGEVDEALKVLAKPVPKLAIASWVKKVVRVRDWILAHREIHDRSGH